MSPLADVVTMRCVLECVGASINAHIVIQSEKIAQHTNRMVAATFGPLDKYAPTHLEVADADVFAMAM